MLEIISKQMTKATPYICKCLENTPFNNLWIKEMSINIRKQLEVIIMKTLYVKIWNVAKGYLEGIL